MAKMAEARLSIGSDWDAPHVVCWFDAWANDDAPHLGAAFAAAVASTANKQRRWWVRMAMPLPSVMLTPEQRWRRRLWLGVLTVALAAAAIFWPTGGSLLTPMLHPGATVSGLGHGTAVTRLAWPLLVVAVIVLAQWLAPSIQGIARWIDNPGSEAARGSMQDASRQLRRLINQALRGKRRFMIFVDNLERCRPPRAVEVCEVVSQLIGHPEVVTVLIGDMDTIALSAEIKYAALESSLLVRPGRQGLARPQESPAGGQLAVRAGISGKTNPDSIEAAAAAVQRPAKNAPSGHRRATSFSAEPDIPKPVSGSGGEDNYTGGLVVGSEPARNGIDYSRSWHIFL